MSLDTLCAAVEACAGKDVLELLTVLLRHCREHEAELRAALDNSETTTRIRACRNAAMQAFRWPSGIHFAPADLAGVCALLRTHGAPPAISAVAARGAALAVETVHRTRLPYCFLARGPELAPNDPFPVVEPPLKEIFGATLNSKPERFTPELDSVPTVRLVPLELGAIRLRLHHHAESALGDLARGAGVAAAIPNAGLHELDWHRFTRDGERRFYHVRPRDRAEQEERLLRCLRAADSAGASLVVLPELCVDEPLLARVRAWWQTAKNVRLLVAGSHHVSTEAPEERRNLAVTLLQDGSEVLHQKYNRFDFLDLDDAGAPPHDVRVEDIVTMPATITVHLVRKWSFATVICKDLLDKRTVDLLIALRVRLIFVPSCSAKTPAFETRALQLATDAQSIVVIANTPAGPGAATAIFARPTGIQPLLVRTAEKFPPPLVWILSLGGDLYAI